MGAGQLSGAHNDLPGPRLDLTGMTSAMRAAAGASYPRVTENETILGQMRRRLVLEQT